MRRIRHKTPTSKVDTRYIFYLFVFLNIVAGGEIDAFLFVIFVSFQGVFICVAFLINRKCFELYRKLIPQRTERSDNFPRNDSSGKIILQKKPNCKLIKTTSVIMNP